ncbi:hypothetical protein [Mycoplasma todarodis]|uniref:Uncharacterized protein n=1 Tax=Mycoplasma todarodis TaxID=1937191 RepID=A0A4R0XRD4_9MOLU|nr:hypothetical protein [Mycoplasma todarodis]TCG10960.1 hypothetical protein C4B25_02620 [Mycoplasma todarodis]
MKTNKLLLSIGAISALTLPLSIVGYPTVKHYLNNKTITKNPYSLMMKSDVTPINYASNTDILDAEAKLKESISKLEVAMKKAKQDAINYKNIALDSTKNTQVVLSSKVKANASKDALLKLKKIVESYEHDLANIKQKSKQKEIDFQQAQNTRHLSSIMKNATIINQGNVKVATIAKEINDLEEAKLQVWKLEEITGVSLPEVENGTTIDEVELIANSNGIITVKAKLFSKYATTPNNNVEWKIKGKSDALAAKSQPPKKLETKQEKAERLTREYNAEVDTYFKIHKEYNKSIDIVNDAIRKKRAAKDAFQKATGADKTKKEKLLEDAIKDFDKKDTLYNKWFNALETEKKKLKTLETKKNQSKAELRRPIISSLISAVLDSAWIVDQNNKTVSEIAKEINDINDIEKKITSIQSVFGILLFKSFKTLTVKDIILTSSSDGAIKIEVKTFTAYVNNPKRTFTKIIYGKSDVEIHNEKINNEFDSLLRVVNKMIDNANNSNAKHSNPIDKNNTIPKTKVVNPDKKNNIVPKKDNIHSTDKKDKKTKSNIGLILGISISIITLVAIISGLLIWRSKRKKK